MMARETDESMAEMDRIEKLYEEWVSLLPMREEDQRRLDRKFMLEFNLSLIHI